MRANEKIALIGDKVVLVPYRKEHVEKYHEWMLDPDLRELTASEPLALEEEYEMQRKWQEDEDKLTFIVLAREDSPNGDTCSVDSGSSIYDTRHMIGDVNLFFKGSAHDEDFEVEAEIMIAEEAYRRKGYASEALQILLSFATSFEYLSTLPISADKLVVRIGDKNSASIALFKKLGFVVAKHVEVFEELEMRLGDTTSRDRWTRGKLIKLE
ncbi:acyl-CoA N-acyltransferase [Fomitiporia mediterranea MF3/22]|uniref:acyl-CoA N-acyltransferase n=1 Tax=Fomitiporia mediterranea (strain MF3/22) TaxID=694068 RepID=UPI0004407AC0|nr:acyl-CoA N-acyltransferase [Fomitiporia mediterranea MF3/22]EJD04587.1 acyl-CoA N-acyltransferase [Fomitiporia mediterranea MF3/22]